MEDAQAYHGITVSRYHETIVMPILQHDGLDVLPGLAAVADSYDAFFMDLWGVVHDGVRPFPWVRHSLCRLREAGKKVVFLSNAPRRSATITGQLARFGIEPALHDGVVSSGEEAWRVMKGDGNPYAHWGRNCYHIGPSRDDGVLEGLDLEPVVALSQADFLLNSGPQKDGDSVEDYAELLAAAAARGLPMLCLNPDLEVIRGGLRRICAGALAARYQRLGAEVRYHGKPYSGVYHLAREVARLALKRPVPCRRILAIGDSLKTDITGARDFGIDSVLVTSGIHAVKDASEAETARHFAFLCRKARCRPRALMGALTWQNAAEAETAATPTPYG